MRESRIENLCRRAPNALLERLTDEDRNIIQKLAREEEGSHKVSPEHGERYGRGLCAGHAIVVVPDSLSHRHPF